MKRPKSELDLLKSRAAKQRNEIGRLTQALERCVDEKRLLTIDIRSARRMGQIDAINLTLEHINNGTTLEQLAAALRETALALQ